MGCWALKPRCEHTIVMYFGTMNTRAAAKITVQTLIHMLHIAVINDMIFDVEAVNSKIPKLNP